MDAQDDANIRHDLPQHNDGSETQHPSHPTSLSDLTPLDSTDEPPSQNGNGHNGHHPAQASTRHRYVRIRLPHQLPDEATEVTPDTVMLSAGAIPSKKTFAKKLRTLLMGRPIPTTLLTQERIGRVTALALLSSDALSSVAYGTEASLAVLITAGYGALPINLALGAVVIGLLAIVVFSYRQTIFHYPNGGGSYVVAKENLGNRAGLVAAAALLIDYILTVSVSVSAGVDALVAAFPVLLHVNVLVGVILISIMVLINLRGVREAGNVFAAPTYIFVGSFLLLLVIGLFHAFTQGGLFHPLPPRPSDFIAVQGVTAHLGIFLILTAFASGCSAMTGVEAISNGVPIFKEPQARNAAQTLVAMAALLAVMYGGTTFLAWRFGITPQLNSVPPVTAQLGQMFFTGWFSWFYYLFQLATTLILVLAANTSFSGFPRLSSLLARDHYLPHIFRKQGDRLAFNTGIIVLAIAAMVLLIAFHGNTDALINLYALGVFTAFTLSQAGMVRLWLRKRRESNGTDRTWVHGLPINGLGAVTTGIVTIIITVSKFDRGAYVAIIMMILLFALFNGIHSHYMHAQDYVAEMQVRTPQTGRHLVVVPISGLDKLAVRGIAYALTISRYVLAVYVDIPDERGDKVHDIREEWQKALKEYRFLQRATLPPLEINDDEESETSIKDDMVGAIKGLELIVVDSQERALIRPIIDFVDTLKQKHEQDLITVVLPEFVWTYPWEALLHNQTVLQLKLALLTRTDIATVSIPYRLHHRRRARLAVEKFDRIP
jgi:amino acid transporter